MKAATRVVTAMLALVSLLGLTACRTNVGAAAWVGDQRISEEELNAYVVPGASPFDNQGTRIYPKTYVLQQIIQGKVIEAAIPARGGPVTAKERADARAKVLGGTSEAAVAEQIAARGFTAKTEVVLVNTAGLLLILQARFAGKTDELGAAARATGLRIRVSPRYGTWDAETLSLKNGPAQGNFITSDPSAAPSPAAVS